MTADRSQVTLVSNNWRVIDIVPSFLMAILYKHFGIVRVLFINRRRDEYLL